MYISFLYKMGRGLCLLLLFGAGSLALLAQSTEQVEESIPEVITDAFKAGNSRMLAEWLSSRTLISIDTKSARYSQQQAQSILKKFFKENPPLGFDFLHQGVPQKKNPDGKGALLYYIATYHSQESYNMYMLVRRSQTRYRISSISFAKQ